jgi:hypothetical protein
MTREECARARDHAEMLRHPEWWPYGYLLPLKRYRAGQHTPELAVATSSDPTTIVFGPIALIDKDAPVQKYASIEALVADGWVVD